MTAPAWKTPLWCACLWAIALCGCRKTAEPQVARSESKASSAAAIEPSALVAADSDSSLLPAAVEPAAFESNTPPANDRTVSPESKERILLLAPGGPLVIDFVLTIDGRPHTEALRQLVEEVLKLADTDGDGRTMWKELCACQRVKYGQFGNLPIDGDNSEKQIIERYDVARDGVVDRSELPRFLTRNAGGSRPFSIRGTLDHRGGNRNTAPTWRILDANSDGVIDSDEKKIAASRLVAKDSDDDEIVTMTELNPRLQTPEPEMMMADRRLRRGPDAARLLGEHADWLSVQRTLEQEYGGGRIVRADNGQFSPGLFKQLDENHDGRLGRDEFHRLNDVSADVVVEVAFGSRQATTSDQPKPNSSESADDRRPAAEDPLKLRYAAFDLSASNKPFLKRPEALTIAAGSMLLAFAINDTVAKADFTAQAKQALAMLDQNKDGYLESSELPEGLQTQFGRFEAVDANGDGKAYPDEIEAYLSQQQAGLRAQIHARVSDAEDLSFAALDVNHDQRLDSREVQGAGERLKELDTDGDGRLTPDELPEMLRIVLARGSLENAETTFSPPLVAESAQSKAPTWFSAMDANQDGAISRREFLGTAEQFDELDRDKSGLLELTDIEAGR